MRYSRGHQDLTCQGCHESIHGLYPVSAAIDTTSYAQAAALNYDGTHGPLKCGTCHAVDGNGIPTWIREGDEDGGGLIHDQINANNPLDPFDGAVTWAHTYTDEVNVLESTCQNCHEDERDEISAGEYQWVRHSWRGRTSRLMMDKAETAELGHVLGAEPGAERDQLCTTCHAVAKNGTKPNYLNKVKNCGTPWTKHLTQGRVSQSVWEDISQKKAGKLCGW
jgi:cytochrome c2